MKLGSMHWTTLGAYIALDTVLCFIPGPAVMAVVGSALSRSRAGFATASGILTGNFIYFVISGLGIASVILASHGGIRRHQVVRRRISCLSRHPRTGDELS